MAWAAQAPCVEWLRKLLATAALNETFEASLWSRPPPKLLLWARIHLAPAEEIPRVRHGPPGVDRYVCPAGGLLWRLSGPPQAPPEANAGGQFVGLFSL